MNLDIRVHSRGRTAGGANNDNMTGWHRDGNADSTQEERWEPKHNSDKLKRPEDTNTLTLGT